MQGDNRGIHFEDTVTQRATNTSGLKKFIHFKINPATFRTYSKQHSPLNPRHGLRQSVAIARMGEYHAAIFILDCRQEILNEWLKTPKEGHFRESRVDRSLLKSLVNMLNIVFLLDQRCLPEAFFHPVGVDKEKPADAKRGGLTEDSSHHDRPGQGNNQVDGRHRAGLLLQFYAQDD